jgi:DNA-binding CsgD family transcriptional regulator
VNDTNFNVLNGGAAGATSICHAALGPAMARTLSYRGPERRDGVAMMARLMALVLDEIDYGLLLVGPPNQVLHANHAAREELDSEHPLLLDDNCLGARLARDQLALTDAVSAASRRGLRRMLSVGDGVHKAGVSVEPGATGVGGGSGGGATLLVLGKRQVCGALSAQGFARSQGLSPGEAQVLSSLCEGIRPADIARRNGVAISTVRTQIANIRQKTGADSIRDLIHQVAVLPPLVGVLRRSHDGSNRPRREAPALLT